MVDTSLWWMMKWPVAAAGFLTTAMGATPDDGHEYARRLRLIMIEHMAQVTRRREEGDSEVMEGMKQQFTPRMPTWTAISKTQVFRIRNLLLKWRRKAATMGARRPKITQWLATAARDPGDARRAASRLTTQQTRAEARAARAQRRKTPASDAAALPNTMSRWVRGAPNGDNDADQTPPDDDTASLVDGGPGASNGAPRGRGGTTGARRRADASGAQEPGIDLDWLPEPGRTQALNGRAAAYGDIGRCPYHTPPYGCTLIEGDSDGPGLIEMCGLMPAEATGTLPGAQGGTVTRSSGAPQPHTDASRTDAATE